MDTNKASMLTTESGVIRSYVVEDRGTLRYSEILPDPDGCPYYGGCPSCYPTRCDCYAGLSTTHIQETVMADWTDCTPDTEDPDHCDHCEDTGAEQGTCGYCERDHGDAADHHTAELRQTVPPAPEGQAPFPGLFMEQTTLL